MLELTPIEDVIREAEECGFGFESETFTGPGCGCGLGLRYLFFHDGSQGASSDVVADALGISLAEVWAYSDGFSAGSPGFHSATNTDYHRDDPIMPALHEAYLLGLQDRIVVEENADEPMRQAMRDCYDYIREYEDFERFQMRHRA